MSITANTTYIVAYFAPNGHYAADPDYWFTPAPTGGNILDSPPLHAVHASTTVNNGFFSYGSGITFPTSTFQDTNYYVDPTFAPATGAPGQPTNVTAAGGNASATVTWTAPLTGGAPTKYTVTPFIGTTAQTPTVITGTPPATQATITGLTNGTSYTFTVTPSNANGTGPASTASNAVTPSNSPPGAPTAVTANPASNQAQVYWTAPTNTGGGAVTSYTITPFAGTTAGTPVQASGTATSANVGGLTNGTAYTFKVTATNIIGNGPASAASAAVTPEDTIFDFSTPGTLDSGDSSSVELGVTFTPTQNGSITGVRFFKSTANTGTHVGSLWSSTGTLLASGTFTGETATGWQTLTFTTPVAVTSGTTYVAGYYAPNGHYSYTGAAFSSGPVVNGPLTAVANSTSSNGVFSYASVSTFPTTTFNAANYWVDVEFQPGGSGGGGGSSAPNAPSGVTAAPGSSSAQVGWTAPNNGGSPITGYTVTPSTGGTRTPVQVSGAATSATVTGLTNGSSYTFTVTATNAIGTSPASAASATVTPEDTIFDFGTPATNDAGDPGSVELGVTFTPSVSGTVNGIRFYKSAANTGTHVGSLWTANGALVASATFTGETSSGWQTLVFSSPVGVTAGTTYVAGYLAPNGHYSYTGSAFTSAVTNGPLTAVANSTSPNGVFSYTGSSAFPTGSFNAANYWVDVLFQPGGSSVPSAPSNVSASPASNQAQVSWSAPANQGTSSITGYTVTPFAGTTAGTPVQVGASTTSTNVPGLTNGTAYTFKVTATNSSGPSQPSAPSGAITPEDTVFDFATPTTADAGDSSGVELGVKFSASASGTIVGLRFYKSAANTGTHVGTLWSSTGTVLATGTFSNETASGWQTLLFTTPVTVTAGTTYVAGYLAPNGHYAATGNGLANGVDNGPLQTTPNATSANGVYAYGSTSTFPTSSFNATNYWIDVLFQPGS